MIALLNHRFLNPIHRALASRKGWHSLELIQLDKYGIPYEVVRAVSPERHLLLMAMLIESGETMWEYDEMRRVWILHNSPFDAIDETDYEEDDEDEDEGDDDEDEYPPEVPPPGPLEAPLFGMGPPLS